MGAGADAAESSADLPKYKAHVVQLEFVETNTDRWNNMLIEKGMQRYAENLRVWKERS